MNIEKKTSEVVVNGRHGPVSTIRATSSTYEGRPLEAMVSIDAFSILPGDLDEFLAEQEKLIKRWAG